MADSNSTEQRPKKALLKEARRLLEEGESLAKKFRGRLPPDGASRLETAIEELSRALDPAESTARIEAALQGLEKALDDHLSFARKGTFREFVESIGVAVLVALLLRAFVIEAFKIPSGSMIPTLEVGDHIFVNKFIYGLRVPMTNAWFVEWGSPQRGDVIVFRFPLDLSKDYIKRVVAVSGDTVRVLGRDVFVNGEKLPRDPPTELSYVEDTEPGVSAPDAGAPRRALAFPEAAYKSDKRHTVLYATDRTLRDPFPNGTLLPGLECGVPGPDHLAECKVKPGYVFCMGDNRDNSFDSRGWGAVPVENVKGKAMFIWWSRGARAGVRWERLGTPVE